MKPMEGEGLVERREASSGWNMEGIRDHWDSGKDFVAFSLWGHQTRRAHGPLLSMELH